MDLQLRGKVALVTGGSKGIGAGCSEVLAEEGCHIAVVYRSDAAYSERFTQDLAERAGVKTMAIQADLSDPRAIDGVYDRAIATLGPIDILVNNAGGGVVSKPFDELTYEEWRRVQDNNLNSAFSMSRRFVHECRSHERGGHIVNVLAKAAITTNSTNNTSYIAAKGGLTTMTRGLANEVTKDGIIVNGIVPGYVQTHGHYHPGDADTLYKQQFLPTGEFATPRDMGVIVAFLCSPLAKQIIGAVVDVSGGTML